MKAIYGSQHVQLLHSA